MSELKYYPACITTPKGKFSFPNVYLKDEADKVIAHNKHKRCLAMAWWCDSEAYIYKHGSEYDEHLAAWFGKWRKRWMEIAEKFKLNKSTAQ